MPYGESQGRCSEENSTYACEQDVGAIKVLCKTKFAPQVAKPEDHVLRPGMSDVIDE